MTSLKAPLGSATFDVDNGNAALADLLIDSDILINHTRGVAEAAEFLRSHMTESRLCISSITQMEWLIGALDKSEQRRIECFLQRFVVVKINAAVCDQAVRYVRRYALSHRLQSPDALIAATATVHGIPLATSNTRDYDFIRGLRLVHYA
jgi:tRNA(fMet)-specific endonuclease VapC